MPAEKGKKTCRKKMMNRTPLQKRIAYDKVAARKDKAVEKSSHGKFKTVESLEKHRLSRPRKPVPQPEPALVEN